jgi:23S rRNA (cytosine1962-C5)-methyltransferase
MTTIPTLILKKNQERRILSGHPWIFSNEIDVAKSPLNSFTPGQAVHVVNASGLFLGSAYINPKTLLAGRIYSRQDRQPLDADFFKARLLDALNLRERMIPAPFYRLAFGEGDGLPGLIIDRFGDYFVVQITTAGMEQVKAILIEVLVELFQPKGILLRNDHSYRETEGLTSEVVVAYGTLPESTIIIENSLRFEVPLLQGQKTGWFYDQRNNRARLKPYVKNARVLDVFSYLGSFAVHACHYGAESVYCVDSSKAACEHTLKNAELNGFTDKITTQCEDAFDALRALQKEAKFDVVLIDPPAFIKKKKDFQTGCRAYQKLNQLALACLKPGGILFSSSCSMHLLDTDLQNIISNAAATNRSSLQLLDYGSQAEDHPVHIAIPETHYLKTFVCRKTTF